MLVVVAYCLARYRCRWVRWRYRASPSRSDSGDVVDPLIREREREQESSSAASPRTGESIGGDPSAEKASTSSGSVGRNGCSGPNKATPSRNGSMVSVSSADYSSPRVTRRAERLSHVPQLRGISSNTDSEADDERTPRVKKCVSFVESRIKDVDMEKETVEEQGSKMPRRSGRKRRLPKWLRGDDVVLT